MSCQESTRRFLLRFPLGRTATLVSILDLVSKLIVESIGQSTFLSFFEDDVCSVFSVSGKFLPKSRHKCCKIAHVRFETSTFWRTKQRLGFSYLHCRFLKFLSHLIPIPRHPESAPGPGFVWVKSWAGVPCWTMLVVSWITGNESIQKDPWNLQTYGCCDASPDWWMKSLGNVELFLL